MGGLTKKPKPQPQQDTAMLPDDLGVTKSKRKRLAKLQTGTIADPLGGGY